MLRSARAQSRALRVAELIRKLFLAVVVLFLWPGSRLQLFAGAFLSSMAALILVWSHPYEDVFAGYVQLAAHLQVLFTFMTTTVFYVDPAPESHAVETLFAGMDEKRAGCTLIALEPDGVRTPRC